MRENFWEFEGKEVELYAGGGSNYRFLPDGAVVTAYIKSIGWKTLKEIYWKTKDGHEHKEYEHDVIRVEFAVHEPCCFEGITFTNNLYVLHPSSDKAYRDTSKLKTLDTYARGILAKNKTSPTNDSLMEALLNEMYIIKVSLFTSTAGYTANFANEIYDPKDAKSVAKIWTEEQAKSTPAPIIKSAGITASANIQNDEPAFVRGA